MKYAFVFALSLAAAAFAPCAWAQDTALLRDGFCEGCKEGDDDACIALSKAPDPEYLSLSCPRANCTYVSLNIGAPLLLQDEGLTIAGGIGRKAKSTGEKQCRAWWLWRDRVIALYGGIPIAEASNVFVIPTFGIVNVNNTPLDAVNWKYELVPAYNETVKLIRGEYDNFSATIVFSPDESDTTSAVALAALVEDETPVITGTFNGPSVYTCPLLTDEAALLVKFPPCKAISRGLRRFTNLFATTSWDTDGFLPFLGIISAQNNQSQTLQDVIGTNGQCLVKGADVALLYEDRPYWRDLAINVMQNERFYTWNVVQEESVSTEPDSIQGTLDRMDALNPAIIVASFSNDLCRPFMDSFHSKFKSGAIQPSAVCFSSCFTSGSSAYFYGQDSRWMSGTSFWDPSVTGDYYEEILLNKYSADLYGLPLFYGSSDEDIRVRFDGTNYEQRNLTIPFADVTTQIEYDLLFSSESNKEICDLGDAPRGEDVETPSMLFAAAFLKKWGTVPASVDASSTVMGYIVSQTTQQISDLWQDTPAISNNAETVSDLLQRKDLWEENLKKTYFRSFFGLVSIDALGQNSASRPLVLQEDIDGEAQIIEPAESRTKQFVYPIPPVNATYRNYPCPPGSHIHGSNRWCTYEEILRNTSECKVALESPSEDAFPKWFNTTCKPCPPNKYSQVNGTLECEICGRRSAVNEARTDCVPLANIQELTIGLIVGFSSLLVFGVSFSWLWWKKSGKYLRLKEERKKRKMPKPGDPVSHVVTDIEGSTNLWEWNSVVMDHALKIHHELVRKLLVKHFGFEISTEGDSFHIIFHNSTDALEFCIGVQEEFLSQSWPLELNAVECAKHVSCRNAPSSLLFKGLRVRMGIHFTEGIENIGKSEMNSLKESVHSGVWYERTTGFKMAKEIGSAASSGGQIFLSRDAWDDLDRAKLSIPVAVLNMGFQRVEVSLPGVEIYQVCPLHLSGRINHFSPMKVVQFLEPPFYNAPCASKAVQNLERVMTPKSRRFRKGFTYASVLKSYLGKSASGDGNGNSSSTESNSNSGRNLENQKSQTNDEHDPESESSSFCRLSPKGTMRFRSFTNPLALRSSSSALGKTDSATSQSVPYRITVVFIHIEDSSRLFEIDQDLMMSSIQLLQDEIRSLILKYNGYMSEVKDADFLLAFSTPADALLFCMDAQESCLKLDWNPDLQSLASTATEYASVKGKRKAIFRGLRMKMGVSEGDVQNTYPHPATGRIAYLGKMLNRSARIAATASGGQILVDMRTFQASHLGGSTDVVHVDMGHLGLKGVKEKAAKHIVQVSSVGLQARSFPEINAEKTEEQPSLISENTITSTLSTIVSVTVPPDSSMVSSATLGDAAPPQGEGEDTEINNDELV